GCSHCRKPPLGARLPRLLPHPLLPGQLRDGRLAVYAPVRGGPRGDDLRPPVDVPGGRRRHQPGRLRLRGRQVGQPHLAGLGPGDAVAGHAARNQRRAHHHQRLRGEELNPHVAQGRALHGHRRHHPPGHPGHLHLRSLPGHRRRGPRRLLLPHRV
ncbi:MAG: Succinate dehydrogenase hydrophobic membrane anchor protein, partial [uncultured Arthrobacter sp.]